MLVAYTVVVVWVVVIAMVILLWSKKQKQVLHAELKCSVIIPFRNEASVLPDLIDALTQQNLSVFEVILIDDHSSDNSFDVAESSLKKSGLDFTILKLGAHQGKKAALAYGIKHAKYDIIITTDADCQMGEFWLESMLNQFSYQEVNLVTGPVHLTGRRFIQRFQGLEQSSLLGFTAATIALKTPTMANGANMAFRRRLFFDLNGYAGIDQIPSGDDELFMHKVQKAYPGSIRFNKDKRAKVITEAKSNFIEMVAQKKRWASKWKVNRRWATVILALFVLLVNLSQLMLIYELLTFTNEYLMPLAAILLKFLAETLLMLQVRSELDERTGVFDLLISFLFYPFYAVYIGIAANFGTYEWKGRRYS